MDLPTEARSAARRQDAGDWLDHAVQIGLVSYALVHLIIAWLALRLVFGDSGGSASGQGALDQLAQTTAGRILLYVGAAGFLALVVWQLVEAGWGHRDREGRRRVTARLGSVGKVVLYAALGFSAARTAVGSASGGGTDGVTTKLMALPAGPLLVGALAVAILGVAGVIAFRGLREQFLDKVHRDGQTGKDGTTYVLLGKVGHLAKAAAVAIVGALFLYAAFTHDPHKSGGLDQALHKLLQQPFGAALLEIIALGFACYGLFCLAWARHLDR